MQGLRWFLVRISELAEQAGVATTTVRYYERIGLLASPDRTASGYRDYDGDDAARLLFISRARRIGLSCEQIADLLPIWNGTDCSAAHQRVRELIVDKQAEIAERIAELAAFSEQLSSVQVTLDATPPPGACRTDLSCCMPDAGDVREPVTLRTRAEAREGRLR
jgi:DNA-binding transcriptional MerR regulator